jgi:hypothetical protein
MLPGVSFQAIAQERCATVEYMQTLQKKTATSEKDNEFEQWIARKIQQRQKSNGANRTQSEPYRIPVVVHIIHNGSNVGSGTNISDEQVFSQIAVLNKDFNRTNIDAATTPLEFQSVAGNIPIEFVLAKRTPDGFATNGIVRVKGTKTSWFISDNAQLKALSYWPSEDYLNLWVCNLQGYLGYAQFPVSSLPGLEEYQNGIATTDGAVFGYRTFGSNGEGFGTFDLNSQYNRGRTVTHEIGHFLGLRHIWGDRSDCNGTDYVNDTPLQNGETYNCPSHPAAACNNTKMFQNYMDYTDDVCMNLFTKGQISRMVNVLENAPRRASLLVSPGLLDPDAPGNDLTISAVLSPSPVVCAAPVQPKIKVRVKGSIETITSFKIQYFINDKLPGQVVSFTGLSLETGDELDVTLPTLTLATGSKPDTLKFEVLEPNAGIDINPFNNAISTVAMVSPQEDVIPLRENFEQFTKDSPWTLVSPTGGLSWTTKKIESNTALYYNGYNNSVKNDQAWFVSPVLDLSDVAQGSLSYKVSYAYRNGQEDNLQILASTDCGNTFDHVLYQASGTQLSNARISSVSWTPASDTDWQSKSLALESLAGERDVRIAFVFTNNNGNNLYLDDIEFFVNANPPKADGRVSVFPNPSPDGQVEIRIDLDTREAGRMEVADMMGRVIAQQDVSHALNQTLLINLSHAAPGIYIVRFTTPSSSWSSPLMIK